jgi:superfamily II RNA helicase
MGGRAGRRGIDTKGNVLLLLNLFSRYEVPVTSLRHMLTGAPQSIQSKFSIHANLILRLISVKNYDFRGFMEKSMITKNIESSRKVVLDKLDNFKKSGDIFYRTSNEILEKMHELKTSVGNLRGNKKKKRLREITILEQSNKFIVVDYDRFVQNMVRDITVKQLKNEILNIDSFIDEEIGIQIAMLIDNEFIIKDSNNLLLTEKGNLAINIQELSSLAMGEILNNRCFDDLDSVELASIISCFTNLHLSDDQSVLVISSIHAPEKVKGVISKVKKTYNKYFDILTKLKLDIVENYQMHFNMVELTIKWCNAEDNIACMKIIQEAKSFDISLGDFVKAILKINNISQELEKAAVVQENLGLLEKLKNISQLTLKSCITNQSLYL